MARRETDEELAKLQAGMDKKLANLWAGMDQELAKLPIDMVKSWPSFGGS